MMTVELQKILLAALLIRRNDSRPQIPEDRLNSGVSLVTSTLLLASEFISIGKDGAGDQQIPKPGAWH